MSRPKGNNEQGLRKVLHQTEETCRALFRSNPHPMWIYDTQTLAFLEVNDAAVSLYGYTEEEFLGMTLMDIRPQEDVPRLLDGLGKVGDGVYRSGLWRHRKKDGTVIQVEVTAHALDFEGRKARVAQVDDVTERERAEAALRASEQRLRTLVAATFEGIAISEAGRFVDVNEQLGRMLGYAREEIIGREITALLPEEDRARVLEKITAGQERQIEHEMLCKDGTRIIVEAHGQTVELEGRKVRFTALRDITQRKGAERALQESEVRYRQLVELMPAAVYACDSEGRIWFYNDRAAALWGCRPNPVESAAGYCEPSQGPSEKEAPLPLACPTGEAARNLTGLIRRADGSQVDVLVNSDPLRDRLGQVVGAISVLTDVTERNKTRVALENQNRRLALLNEAAAQLLSVEEPDQAMARIYEGIAADFQTSGFLEFELNERGDALDLKSCLGIGEPQQECDTPHLKMGEGIVGTVAQRRQAMVLGRVLDSTDAKARLLKELGIRAYACYPLMVGERLLGTLSFASRKREKFEAEDLEFFETLAGYLALSRERRRLKQVLQLHAADLEQTVEERTRRLREVVAELEHISYSIIHDMRAPLRAIQGYATIIAERESGQISAISRDMFERMITASNRMDLLITDVLRYGRAVQEEVSLQPVDLGSLLRTMLQSYPELESSRADVRLEGEFPVVLGNEAGLTQCFSNLLNNAVKFVPPGTRPQVRVWAEVRGDPGMVRVWVEDNGTGIPKAFQGKLFQMFRRMHGPEYEGTGIGLALVRKVVERMGGRVGVESEEGQGSRFWLELTSAVGLTHNAASFSPP